MNWFAGVVVLPFLVACAPLFRSAPPALPREATVVNASLGRTWDAVIDALVEENISIATLERSSGVIVSASTNVENRDAGAIADCGGISGIGPRAQAGVYNVLVRGDSSRATVRVTVRFTHLDTDTQQHQVCTSRGVWESTLETRAKARAESSR